MPSKESPTERILRQRANAHRLHAKHNSADLTAAARKTFLDRFLDEVDPHRELTEDERNQRAEHARRAYFLDLARKSVQARRQRALRYDR